MKGRKVARTLIIAISVIAIFAVIVYGEMRFQNLENKVGETQSTESISEESTDKNILTIKFYSENGSELEKAYEGEVYSTLEGALDNIKTIDIDLEKYQYFIVSANFENIFIDKVLDGTYMSPIHINRFESSSENLYTIKDEFMKKNLIISINNDYEKRKYFVIQITDNK